MLLNAIKFSLAIGELKDTVLLYMLSSKNIGVGIIYILWLLSTQKELTHIMYRPTSRTVML
jgi:hypothetical protein